MREAHRRLFFSVLNDVMPAELRAMNRVQQFFYNRVRRLFLFSFF